MEDEIGGSCLKNWLGLIIIINMPPRRLTVLVKENTTIQERPLNTRKAQEQLKPQLSCTHLPGFSLSPFVPERSRFVSEYPRRDRENQRTTTKWIKTTLVCRGVLVHTSRRRWKTWLQSTTQSRLLSGSGGSLLVAYERDVEVEE